MTDPFCLRAGGGTNVIHPAWAGGTPQAGWTVVLSGVTGYANATSAGLPMTVG
jgi:hypothetical protein